MLQASIPRTPMLDIYSFLATHGIAYERFDHGAVFTVDDARKLPAMPGSMTKNLFLKDKAGRLILVTVSGNKSVDLTELGEVLQAKKISFASPETLKEFLGVEPGSVTILGLIHDDAHAVEVVIDRALWEGSSALQCHPLVNTASLVLTKDAISRFLQVTGHIFQIVDVPERMA